jgi:hypothetical protein
MLLKNRVKRSDFVNYVQKYAYCTKVKTLGVINCV